MNTKEIDIIELIAKLLKIFRKWIILLLIFMVVGAGLGYYQYKKAKTTYRSTMISKSDFVSNLRIVDYVAGFNAAVQNKSEENAAKLGIPADYLKNIKSISATASLELSSSQYLYTKDQNIDEFNTNEINIEMYDTTGMSAITQAMINYIDNVGYVKQEMKKAKQTAQEIIEKIDNEIKKYDSLQVTLFNEQNSRGYVRGNNIGLIEALERKAFYNDIINTSSITVMKDFSMGVQTKAPGMIMAIVIAVFISIIVWFVVIFKLELWKRIRTYNRANK